MVYGDKMSIGRIDLDGTTPLWDTMDREAWKKEVYYSLYRWCYLCYLLVLSTGTCQWLLDILNREDGLKGRSILFSRHAL